MKEGRVRGLKTKIFKGLALVFAFVAVTGSLPSKAASSKSVEVKTKKKLLSEIAKISDSTIIFTTAKAYKITIPASEASENKKLIVNAPNVSLTNKATFKGVTLNETKMFTEKAVGNSLTVKAENAVINVGKGGEVAKMTIEGSGAKVTVAKGSEVSEMNVAADKIDIDVLGKAKVGDLVCKLKGAEVVLNVEKKADVNITLSKKTKLTVTGDKEAEVDITSKAKNSSVTAFVPVEIAAEKNLKLKLEEGAEGSVVDSKSEDVKVSISGEAKEAITEKVAGETVKEPEKNEISDDKKEEKKETTSPTEQTSNNGSETYYQPSYTPLSYEVRLEITDTEVKSAKLFIGNTMITSGTGVEPGTTVRLVVTLEKKRYPVVTVNGMQSRVVVSGHQEEEDCVEHTFDFAVYSPTVVKVTSTDPVINYNSPEHGDTYLVTTGIFERLESGTVAIASNYYFLNLEPEDGYFPRVRINGVLEEVCGDIGNYYVGFSGSDYRMNDNGALDCEVEYVSAETEYTVTIEQTDKGTIEVKNLKTGQTISSGDKVKVGTKIKITVEENGTAVFDGMTISYDDGEGGHGPSSKEWETIITADSYIFFHFGKCLINGELAWYNDESVVGYLEIDTGTGSWRSSFDVIRSLLNFEQDSFEFRMVYPETKVLSLLVNDVEKVDQIVESDANGHVYRHTIGKEKDILIKAVLGKLDIDYVKIDLHTVDNATAQLTYVLSGFSRRL